MNQFIKYVFITICSSFILAGCKKNSDSISYETKISFTYAGQQYNRTSPSRLFTNLILVQNELLFVNFSGLEIEAQNLLGGNILIFSQNPGAIQCAYLRPTGSSVGGDCGSLQSGGNPIDSVQVYWYESGSISFSYSDCRAVTGAVVPGQKNCGITGSFDLTLTNKNNQKIKLTNGFFSGRMKIYP